VNDQFIKVLPTARPDDQLKDTRLWSKSKRASLSAEALDTFASSATGYVLAKNNKLAVVSSTQSDDGKLERVRNLQQQLRAIRDHLYLHDLDDVFQIVMPTDVHNSPVISKAIYNLCTEFPQTTGDIVAYSNAWYRKWPSDPTHAENLDYSYRMLKNNTEATLWDKCMETYLQYDPIYRGGPLMFYLILKRIHSTTESALQFLLNKVRTLKIRDLKGEDADLAISLIRSCHEMLKASSTVDRNYVPDDFPQIVLKALQTSSNHAFNRAFATEELDIQHKADKENRAPEWPDVEEILNLATNMYNRMSGSNTWLTSRDHRRRALTTSTSMKDGRSTRRHNGPSNSGYRRHCWNCGSPDHELADCPSPKDEAKIEKARQDYFKFKRQNQTRPFRGPDKRDRRHGETRLASDGTPMIRNKRGKFVPDQKRLHLAHRTERTQALNAAIDEMVTRVADTAESPTEDPDRTPLRTNATSSQQTALATQIEKVKLSASKLFN
jgi:hypothetical protein